MGQFIDQVQRNNALQQQQLTIKQQERKAKEEKQKELARIKVFAARFSLLAFPAFPRIAFAKRGAA